MKTEPLPTAPQRQAAKQRILEDMGSWLGITIDELFEMADDDKVPEITWRDLNELRQHICGRVANELDYLGDRMETILEEVFADADGESESSREEVDRALRADEKDEEKLKHKRLSVDELKARLAMLEQMDVRDGQHCSSPCCPSSPTVPD